MDYLFKKNNLSVLFRGTMTTLAILCFAFSLNAQPALVVDLAPGYVDSNPRNLIVYNGDLYFTVSQPATGIELYKYDGQAVSLAGEVHPGPTGTSFYNGSAFVFQNKLYIIARTNALGYELWSYDGQNMSLVQDLDPGTGSSTLLEATEYNGKIYFAGYLAATGTELYEFDGTTISLVSEINPGTASSLIHSLIVYQNDLYFTALAPNGVRKLHKYDKNSITLETGHINPTKKTSQGGFFPNEFQGKLYLGASNPASGLELASWDGSNIDIVANVSSGRNKDSFNKVIGTYNNQLLFNSRNDALGRELWMYDGAQVTLLADMVLGAGSSDPFVGIEFDGKFFFKANGELMVYDGNIVSKYADLTSRGYSVPNDLTLYNGSLYYVTKADGYGRELFVIQPSGGAKTVHKAPVSGLYPSPADDMIQLSTSGLAKGKVSISMLDLKGRQVMETLLIETLENATVNQELSVANLPGGLYFIRIEQNGAFEYLKFTVQH